jgi:hypothetical protein
LVFSSILELGRVRVSSEGEVELKDRPNDEVGRNLIVALAANAMIPKYEEIIGGKVEREKRKKLGRRPQIFHQSSEYKVRRSDRQARTNREERKAKNFLT